MNMDGDRDLLGYYADASPTGRVDEQPDFSHIGEKKVLRKMDLRLIPVLAILYLLCFLDRGNIGNAKIQGMDKDLNLVGTQYNIALTVFFLTYTTFELPSNLLLKKLRPSIWLPAIMVAWGIVTTLTGLVQDYHGLVVARLFLGVAEAGLYPGVTFYITMWYCRSEAQFRQSLFYSGASIAGAFSGLLAYALAKMNGVGGLEGWRWIFIIEGILTALVGFAAFFMLYDFPETASFLAPEERAWVIHRLKYQGSAQSGKLIAEEHGFRWQYVWDALSDWQLWTGLFMYFGIVCPLYGISYFLPTIINQLGYTAATAQLLTIPIYFTASILAVVVGYLADKQRRRFFYTFTFTAIIGVGFVLAIIGSAIGTVPGLVYAGVFIATCGVYPAFPGNIQWLASNMSGSYKRAAGMALHIGIGNFGGAMASNFYRTQDK
jgi:MFS family permease